VVGFGVHSQHEVKRTLLEHDAVWQIQSIILHIGFLALRFYYTLICLHERTAADLHVYTGYDVYACTCISVFVLSLSLLLFFSLSQKNLAFSLCLWYSLSFSHTYTIAFSLPFVLFLLPSLSYALTPFRSLTHTHTHTLTDTSQVLGWVTIKRFRMSPCGSTSCRNSLGTYDCRNLLWSGPYVSINRLLTFWRLATLWMIRVAHVDDSCQEKEKRRQKKWGGKKEWERKRESERQVRARERNERGRQRKKKSRRACTSERMNKLNACILRSLETSTSQDTHECGEHQKELKKYDWRPSYWQQTSQGRSHCIRHTATQCNIYCNSLNTLHHTATHCNTLQHTATHCNTLQHTAMHCNTKQHAATRCNEVQHAATRRNTPNAVNDVGAAGKMTRSDKASVAVLFH